MAESAGGVHPDSAALQSYADGGAYEDSVALHVASCATCGDEIAALRRLTAALSLGSKAPDSLAANIEARRRAASRAGARKPLPRPRPRARAFMLPVGLAAAAALAILVPRAMREALPNADPPASGAKGGIPASGPVLETVLTALSRGPLDSVVRALAAPGTTAEILYTAGGSEPGRTLELADSVAAFLRARGVAADAVVVRPHPAHASTGSMPEGGVRITVRPRASSTDP